MNPNDPSSSHHCAFSTMSMAFLLFFMELLAMAMLLVAAAALLLEVESTVGAAVRSTVGALVAPSSPSDV